MTNFMRGVLHELPQNILRSFQGYNILWHGLAIILTYMCVMTGFDWWYFESTRSEFIFSLAIPAGVIGFFIPILLPFSLFVIGGLRHSLAIKNIGAALLQSAILGWFVSSFYKAFTGRIQPDLFTNSTYTDISNNFNFGFFENGIFWGWPSSHTAVAFAMAATLITLFPRRTGLALIALLGALYIGIGVSVTFHWFSDFLAGAIIGSVVGITVGKSFLTKNQYTLGT